MPDHQAPELCWCPLTERVLTRVSGPDARSFLQNIVTNDIERLRPDRALYAALLTPQGMYLHDFLLAEFQGDILIESDRERQPDLARKLTLYRLRSKATIEVEPDLAVGAGFGACAHEAVQLDPARGTARGLEEGIAFIDPRAESLGVRTYLPARKLADFFTDAGFERADTEQYEGVRLEAGVPDGNKDLVIGRSYLLESNFDLLDGVSFSKGCYIGQENTARQRYRGTIRRRLARISVTSGTAPSPGTPIHYRGRDAGTMRSSHAGTGVAHLRLGPAKEALAAGAELEAGDARIRIREPLPEPPAPDRT